MKSKLTKAWGEWLGSDVFKWEIYMTLHYYRPTSSKSATNLISKIRNNNSELIKYIFFINEREKCNVGVHSHILIQTIDKPQDIIEKMNYVNSFANLHYEFIDLEKHREGAVAYYVTKFIDREGIDYDLILRDPKK